MAEALISHIADTIALGADKGLPFSVRTAREGDLKFIDALQKRFNNELGFLPSCALEGHLKKNRISIGFENDEPAGYILAKEGYQRDPRSCILYQCAIEYSAQRHLLGSSLLEHAISLMPRGTQRASAWVAQDIEANFFWEACGFQPIAARQGSKRKGRVHIFWQRVLGKKSEACPRAGGDRGQKSGFVIPEETRGGLMRERRVVVPIGKGEEWKEFCAADFPDPPPLSPECAPRAKHGARVNRRTKESVEAQRRQFVTGAQGWMWLVINGVGRYLPRAVEIDVPEFMDQPSAPMAIAADDAGSNVIPSSQIPGVGMKPKCRKAA